MTLQETTRPRHVADPLETRTLGEIVGDLSRDVTTLVRQEMELARTELREEVARAGKGAGMLGGAGVAGHLVLLFGSLSLMFLLDLWMPTACAALSLAAIWAAVAVVLARRGREQLKSTTPPLPGTQRTLGEARDLARNARPHKRTS